MDISGGGRGAQGVEKVRRRRARVPGTERVYESKDPEKLTAKRLARQERERALHDRDRGEARRRRITELRAANAAVAGGALGVRHR